MQAASPSPHDKSSWRKEFRRRLKDHAEPTETSEALCRQLVSGLPETQGKVIASFAALPGEARLLTLLQEVPDAIWCFPRVVGHDLCFHQVTEVSNLMPGAMSILEPKSTLPVVVPSAIDIVLCPGLGFGRDGSRLGRGRGYYDRTLASCRDDTQIIGIALPQQIVDTVPIEPHDRFMDQLATVEGILAPRPRTT